MSCDPKAETVKMDKWECLYCGTVFAGSDAANRYAAHMEKGAMRGGFCPITREILRDFRPAIPPGGLEK